MKNNIILALTLSFILVMTGNYAQAQSVKNDKKKTVATVVKAKEINTDEFNKLVYDMNVKGMKYLGNKPAIIDFTAKWCGPCQRISPILDELAKEYDGKIDVYKVDIDKNPELAKAFGVRSIPAILYIPLDGESKMTNGARDKSRFQYEINSLLLGKD